MIKIGVASLVVVISLAVAVCCAGCTSSTTPSPSPGSTTAVSNATALGASITVMQGQNFTIQLQSNPSTGYHWEPTYDNSTITLVNRAYIASSIPRPGAPGADVFTFQGTKQGTSVITFDNLSPSNQTANSVNYTITCTSSNVTQGNAVLVSQGQNFTIQLQSNPSTGYHWEPTYDNSTITLVNRAFVSGVSTASTSLVTGAAGTDLVTFQGTKQGTSVITFNKISPSNETTNSLSYTVVITS
ncbi:MAG: protease inhibitor I42 family protein [Halobacteriota archaeon]